VVGFEPAPPCAPPLPPERTCTEFIAGPRWFRLIFVHGQTYPDEPSGRAGLMPRKVRLHVADCGAWSDGRGLRWIVPPRVTVGAHGHRGIRVSVSLDLRPPSQPTLTAPFGSVTDQSVILALWTAEPTPRQAVSRRDCYRSETGGRI